MTQFPEYDDMSSEQLQVARAALRIAANAFYGSFSTTTRCVLGFPITSHAPNHEYYSRLKHIKDRLAQLKGK